MTRVHDWPVRLAAFIEARRARAFCWGDQDCCLFAADWIAECAGTDPAAAFRNSYSDARGAARVLKAHGGIGTVVDTLLGERIAPAFAGRGDVAMVLNSDRECLAVVDGAHAIGPGAAGLVWLPLAGALAAWRV